MEDDLAEIRHNALGQGRQVLETSIMIPRPVEEVFAFFADAENLERITPPELAFQIVTSLPIPVAKGCLIDYRLRLFGVPFGWRTCISVWEPPLRFVDEQLKGPYRSWRHEHSFETRQEGTRMTDRVEYRLPFHPVGGLALPLVRQQLDRIFRFRAKTICALLR